VMGLYGLLLPGVLVSVLFLLGVRLPVTLPLGACLLAGLALFFAPDLVIRAQASERRQEFRRAVGAYLNLVALERGADGGPADALTRAAAVGDGWAFQSLSDALVTARVSGEAPWIALASLAARVGVGDLSDLADVVAVAGDDGAAIATTLAAKAEALRAEQLADSRAAANAASEKLTLPSVALAFAFLLLICYPALARILGS
jgi:pilus assembly protein TadC